MMTVNVQTKKDGDVVREAVFEINNIQQVTTEWKEEHQDAMMEVGVLLELSNGTNVHFGPDDKHMFEFFVCNAAGGRFSGSSCEPHCPGIPRNFQGGL